jgi:hypothetical protein
MIPLMITPEVRDRAKAVVTYAKKRVQTTRDIQAVMDGRKPNVGADPGHCLDIPCDYIYITPDKQEQRVASFKVVYSLELQPCGLCHHISMSIPSNPDRVPHPMAFELVWQDLFGIHQPLQKAIHFWKEAVNGGITAINVLFLMEGELDIRSKEAEALNLARDSSKIESAPKATPTGKRT